jgi:hypothetical protein
MAVTVVSDVPRRSWGARTGAGLARAAGIVVGGLLVLIGLLPLMALFLLIVVGLPVAMGAALSQKAQPALDGVDLADVWVAVCAVVPVVVVSLIVGIRLLRGRRRLVLFLRRFGHTAATHVVTLATTRIGGRWRFVTLDDASVAPVGVGAMTEVTSAFRRMGAAFRRAFKATGQALAVVLVLTFVGCLADYFLAPPGTDPSSASFSDTTAGVVFRILVAVAVVAGGLLLAGFALVLLQIVVVPVAMVGSSVARAVRDAEGAKALEVPNQRKIVAARDRARRLSRKVFSPRLMVLRVDSAIWQQTVDGVGYVAHVPLIDVSDATDNVNWEIERMTSRFGPRCVFIGEHSRLVYLTTPAAADSPAHRVQQLLDGHTVLAYTADDAGSRRFVGALRAALDHSVRTPLTGPEMPDPLPRQLIIDARREVMRERRQARRARLEARLGENPRVR